MQSLIKREFQERLAIVDDFFEFAMVGKASKPKGSSREKG